MTLQAYLFLALIPVLLLDLWLIFWTRHNLNSRGITAEDERARFLFNVYSPALIWVNCAYTSFQEPRNKPLRLPGMALIKQRSGAGDDKVIEDSPGKYAQESHQFSSDKPARVRLRFHLAKNECIQITVDSLPVGQDAGLLGAERISHVEEPVQPQLTSIDNLVRTTPLSPDSDEQIYSKREDKLHDFREFAKHWLVTDLIIFLAIVPIVLVIMDRWLNKSPFLLGLNEYWKKISAPLGLIYPAYFLIILFSLVVIFILFLLRREELIEVNDPGSSQLDRHQAGISTARRTLRSKIFLYGSGLCLLLGVFVNIRLDIIAGWWFILAILMYFSGWLLGEIHLQQIIDYIRKNGPAILSYAFFCLALLYLLAALNLNWNYVWIYLLVGFLTFANLLRYHKRIHLIFWFVPLALILNAYRLSGWEFSVIGDEYSFFEYAMQLATERNTGYIGSHIFDGRAVFSTHPFFSSFLQMITMKFFGVNNFGWRISNVLIISASIPLFYYYYRSYTSQFIAVAATLFIGASHYLMTFGKIGYNNLQAFFMLALVLFVSAWTVKTKRRIQYVVLGFSLGICFYVYPAAIYVLGIWLIFMLFYDPPKTRETVRNWLVMGGMFLIIIVPVLLQPDYWTAKVAGTLFYSPKLLENIHTVSRHVISNLLYSLFSFLYLPEEAHYVTVAYVDPLTAVLTLLGILLSLLWVRKDRFIAFNVIGFLALLLLVGASHDRYYPPSTRMFLLLPWFAFFASIGLRWLYNQITRIVDRPFNPKYFISAIFIVVLMLNLYHAYFLSIQRTSRYQSQEALFLRLVQSMQSMQDRYTSATRFLFLTDGSWDINGYRRLLDVYAIPGSLVELDRYVVEAGDWSQEVRNTIRSNDTVVVVYASMDQGMQADISTQLTMMNKQSCPIAAYDGSIRLYLWYSPQMQNVCGDI